MSNLNQDFINKARAVHGDRYDYTGVDYKNTDTRVKIVCPEHGVFYQTPYIHVNLRCNCPKCGIEIRSKKKTYTTEEFVSKAKTAHGDKYDYSEVDYVKSDLSVTIICQVHGKFEQTPRSHLQGAKCPECANKDRTQKQRYGYDYFIEKAREAHGDQYDYSQIDYVDMSTKVNIICPVHGVFSQTPNSHVTEKRNCPKCSFEIRAKKLSGNSDDFIRRAKETHGDKYDYSEVNYVNSHTKVTIGCPIHGKFEQTPNNHYTQGCLLCGGKVKLTTEQFIEKVRQVHGDVYDYSEVEYVNAKTPVKIICKKHGPWYPIPGNFTNGAGCYSCQTKIIVDTAEFIERAKATHGDLYDYSESNYIDSRTKVTIICKKHGKFDQVTSEHIRGRGCKECGVDSVSVLNKLTTQEFIEKAKAVHGDLYDYSEVEYTYAVVNIKIICKKHGVFYQRPTAHLNGRGCQVCSASKGETAIAKILTKHNFEFLREYIVPKTVYKFRYDFYVPSLNLLIEFHGVQHYEPVEYFGGQEGLENTKLRDAMKKTLANVCGYGFFEIGYSYLENLSEEEFEKRILLNLRKFEKMQKRSTAFVISV